MKSMFGDVKKLLRKHI